jgi:hypothetical protein
VFQVHGERLRPRWHAVNNNVDLSASGLQPVGDFIARRGTDRFGQPHLNHVAFHSVHVPSALGDFIAQARVAFPALPPHVMPLSRAYRLHGTTRFTAVEEPALTTPTGYRLLVEPRLGFDAQGDGPARGLDLSPPVFAEQRGLVVALPVLPGRSATQISDGEVMVLFRRRDWRRANTVLADPLRNEPGAQAYLPRIPDGAGGWRDVILELPTWQVVDEVTDLSLGTGVRWSWSSEPGEPRLIRVVVDGDGDLQALLVPP